MRRPPSVPSRPHDVYAHGGWEGWGHWLGTGNLPGGSTPKKKTNCLPFGEALAVARLRGLGNRKAWMARSKSSARPASMPSSPDQAYKHNGWEGWRRWLGRSNLGIAAGTAQPSTVERALPQVLPRRPSPQHGLPVQPGSPPFIVRWGVNVDVV